MVGTVSLLSFYQGELGLGHMHVRELKLNFGAVKSNPEDSRPLIFASA